MERQIVLRQDQETMSMYRKIANAFGIYGTTAAFLTGIYLKIILPLIIIPYFTKTQARSVKIYSDITTLSAQTLLNIISDITSFLTTNHLEMAACALSSGITLDQMLLDITKQVKGSLEKKGKTLEIDVEVLKRNLASLLSAQINTALIGKTLPSSSLKMLELPAPYDGSNDLIIYGDGKTEELVVSSDGDIFPKYVNGEPIKFTFIDIPPQEIPEVPASVWENMWNKLRAKESSKDPREFCPREMKKLEDIASLNIKRAYSAGYLTIEHLAESQRDDNTYIVRDLEVSAAFFLMFLTLVLILIKSWRTSRRGFGFGRKSSRKASRKSPRKVSRRKTSKRKVSRRKTSKIKVSRRKTSKRKVSRRKTSKRKVSRRKVSRRKVSRRKVSKRKTSRRKTSRRKTSRRKVSKI